LVTQHPGFAVWRLGEPASAATHGDADVMKLLAHSGPMNAQFCTDLAQGLALGVADRMLTRETVKKIVPGRRPRCTSSRRDQIAGPINVTLCVDRRDQHLLHVCVPGSRADSAGRSPRNFAFGDSYVFFANATEFLERVRRAFPATGRRHRSWLVDYVDLDLATSSRRGRFHEASQVQVPERVSNRALWRCCHADYLGAAQPVRWYLKDVCTRSAVARPDTRLVKAEIDESRHEVR
jgi:hypothetical protein